MSVNSLAFKRFLEIAKLLKRQVAVVTDNDGDVAALQEKYKAFMNETSITIHFDSNPDVPSLEEQLIDANGLLIVNKVLDKNFPDLEAARKYMKKNKTDCALKFFDSKHDWKVPQYIEAAVEIA